MSTQLSPRRLPPGARRRQIIDAAYRLISERGDAEISTADVAQAAGVTRALVHHYFRGIDELLDAVTQQLVASSAPGSLGAGTEIPVRQRVPHNVAAFLGMIEANRGVWLAAMAARAGTKGASPGPDLLREAFLERILANNTDLITDTPWARLCLAGYVAFSETIARRWLLGEASRNDAQRALTDTLLHLLLETIPRH
jgi:AcrR family transcriptional regulator